MVRPRRTLRRDITHATTARRAPAAFLTLGLALMVMAPGATAQSPAPSGEPLDVVATTTVLADLVGQTGGDLVTVTSLVPKGGEVHTFDPSPEDAARVAEADLIVMNGLGLDEWLNGLVESVGAEAVPVVELAGDLPGVVYQAHDEHEEGGEESHAAGEEDEDGHEGANPHLWLDVSYAELYVDRIEEALSAADPDRATRYAASGAAYRERLSALDAEIRDLLATIPETRRAVVSLHEAFPYFAAAYGLRIVGTVLDNPGQEPSAADVAALIDDIKAQGVAAIFAESQFPDDLVDTIAGETGIPVVRGLYNDTLGESPADTYEGMMRTNAQLVADALQ